MFRFWKGLNRESSLTASWGTGVSALIFPLRCPFCGVQVSGGQKPGWCPECREGIRWLTAPCCSLCGHPYPQGGGDHLCERCLREPPYFDRARSLVVYQGPVARAIQRFKYQKDFLLTASLARLAEHYPWEKEWFDVLIPVPLHLKRLRERGFNQVVLLSRACRDLPSKKLKPRALRRIRPTASQIHLTPAERLKNVAGAFQVSRPGEVAGKEIMLIDDVYTTGATVNECARTLKKAGAERVTVFTLARVVPA
ncbi:MAG: ComF family protein [Deltaproteobacteria bacterium]|nr:ComF family protein [Deltaproteobacteria bacterium]